MIDIKSIIKLRIASVGYLHIRQARTYVMSTVALSRSVGGIHAQSGLPGRPWPSFMSGGLSRHGWCWSDDDDDTARVDGTQEHMQHVGFLSR